MVRDDDNNGEPPCSVYARLLADIEAIGWQRVSNIGDRLSSIDVCIEYAFYLSCFFHELLFFCRVRREKFECVMSFDRGRDRDNDGRQHTIQIQLPPLYPEVAPRVVIDSPLPFEHVRWLGARSSLVDVVHQCEAVSVITWWRNKKLTA